MYAGIKYQVQGITSCTTYENGAIKECKVNEYNTISTKYGDLIPRYKRPGMRGKDTKALSFYESGALKSIALEEQFPVNTSIGVFPAELITFYEDGSIDSLFPLNGQIGFGWSEEDEKQLAETYAFDFPFAEFSAPIIGLRFFQSQKLKSLILWPGALVDIDTPIGTLPVRIGFRLYEDGSVESVEPARPLALKTPMGEVTAFNPYAFGADADYNSIRFDQSGNLACVYTNSDIVINHKITGKREIIYQQMRLAMESDALIKVPVKLYFEKDNVTIDNGAGRAAYKIREYNFLVLYDGSYRELKCNPGSDCSGCGALCI